MVINEFLFHRLVKCWKFYEYKNLVTIPIFFKFFFIICIRCAELLDLSLLAKTHKSNNFNEININDLKFRAIIDQTNTYSNDTFFSQEDTLPELKDFQDFQCRNFKQYEYHKETHPKSNQLARTCGTAKTQTFNNINGININDLKFTSIIDQTSTYTHYQTAKLISDYLKPLRSNEFTVKDTQIFAAERKPLPPLNLNPATFSHYLQTFLQRRQ